jgi:hypothetical protein
MGGEDNFVRTAGLWIRKGFQASPGRIAGNGSFGAKSA